MEFPHLLQLIKHNQFDTIYHEHFSYFSLLTATTVFQSHGLADLRRRRDTDPRRVAADLRLPRRLRRPRDLAERARVAERRDAPPRSTPSTVTSAIRPASNASSTSCCSFSSTPATGSEDGRLRRARQRQHTAQLLRHSRGPDRLHRRSEPAQARSFPAGNTLTDLRPRHSRDATRLCGDPAVEPARRDHATRCHYIREWGGQFVIPVPSLSMLA